MTFDVVETFYLEPETRKVMVSPVDIVRFEPGDAQTEEPLPGWRWRCRWRWRWRRHPGNVLFRLQQQRRRSPGHPFCCPDPLICQSQPGPDTSQRPSARRVCRPAYEISTPHRRRGAPRHRVEAVDNHDPTDPYQIKAVSLHHGLWRAESEIFNDRRPHDARRGLRPVDEAAFG